MFKGFLEFLIIKNKCVYYFLLKNGIKYRYMYITHEEDSKRTTN